MTKALQLVLRNFRRWQLSTPTANVRRAWSLNSPAGAGVLLALLLVAVSTLGLVIGPMPLSLEQLRAGLLREGTEPAVVMVVWDLRLPRVLLGALVGAALAMAGAVMQGLFRNPLADPGLIGVTGGAAFGAVAYIVLGGTLLQFWG